MEQINLGQLKNSTRYDQLSREELITHNSLLEAELLAAFREIYRLKNQKLTDEQLKLVMSEQLGELQGSLYGASSERYKKPETSKKAPSHQNQDPSSLPKGIPMFPSEKSWSPLTKFPPVMHAGRI